MEITSRENETFKNLLKLTQKKYRKQSGLCIIEGLRMVREHVDSAEKIFIRSSRYNDFMHESWSDNAVRLSGNLFDLVTGLDNDPGVLAVVRIPKSKEPDFPFVVLDGVSDPGNVGAIMRSAAAFGYETIFCRDCVDIWALKTLRAGAGMQFKLNIIEVSLDGFREYLNNAHGVTLICADLNGHGTFIAGKRFGLVFGNEGQGVTKEMRTLCHKVVTIPMKKGVQSLNVAVAAGILMHQFKK
jgi:TrmH family RNA methyltransferase